MPLKDVWVIARSAAGRPCLIHKLLDGQAERTACGRDVSGWSRSFIARRPALEILLCLSRACRS